MSQPSCLAEFLTQLNLQKDLPGITLPAWQEIVNYNLETHQTQALRDFSDRLERMTPSVEVWEWSQYILARALFQQGKAGQAEATLEQVRRDGGPRDMDRIQFMTLYTMVAAANGDYDKAEDTAWYLFRMGERNLDYGVMLRILERTRHKFYRDVFEQLQTQRLKTTDPRIAK
jgi:hypothetical protein